jgi:hypothetical protein
VVDIYRLSLRNVNGDLWSQREILGDIADLIRRAPNDQARGQIAQAAFGRVGPELADALRGGSVALDRMFADPRKAGDVVDRDLIQRAEILDDRFDALTRRVGNFFKALAVGATGGGIETPLNTLTGLFGSIERAQAALGAVLFEALTRDLTAFDQAAGAVERKAVSADGLRAAVRASLADLHLLTSELLDLGDLDLAQAVLGLSDELLDAQIAFQNGELSVRDFEDAVRDSATRATELLGKLEAVDSAYLAGIVARFRALDPAIILQPAVDDPGKSIQLRPLHRGLPPIAGRHRERHHLGYAVARDAEMTRCLALAHSLGTGQSHSTVQVHGENPPALPVARKGKGGRLLRRPQKAHPAATVANFCTAVLSARSIWPWTPPPPTSAPSNSPPAAMATVPCCRTCWTKSLKTKTSAL